MSLGKLSLDELRCLFEAALDLASLRGFFLVAGHLLGEAGWSGTKIVMGMRIGDEGIPAKVATHGSMLKH